MVSQPAYVNTTQILVAPSQTDDRQLTVYSNSLKNMSTNNAMVLPVPHPESVELLDLTNYSHIFGHADIAFEEEEEEDCDMGGSGSYLQIHDVGDYRCSIAMNVAEIKRVDTDVFKLSHQLSDVLTKYYSDDHWGFIICKLKDAAERKPAQQTVDIDEEQEEGGSLGFDDFDFGFSSRDSYDSYHPFAYTHQIVGDKLFVPTRHYHGGDNYEMKSDFKHAIYFYNGTSFEGVDYFTQTSSDECFVEFDRVPFKVAPLKKFTKVTVANLQKNDDITAKIIV